MMAAVLDVSQILSKIGPVVEFGLITGLLILQNSELILRNTDQDKKPILIMRDNPDNASTYTDVVLPEGAVHASEEKKKKLRLPSLLGTAKFSSLVLGLFIALNSLMLMCSQYLTWKSGAPGTYFLPPYRPSSYWHGYVWEHFGKNPAATLILAAMIFGILILANFLSKGRFFYDEEPYLAAAGILANAWPNNLFIIVATLVVGLLVQLVLSIKGILKKQPVGRFALVHFWLPFALVGLFLGDKISLLLRLSQFKF